MKKFFMAVICLLSLVLIFAACADNQAPAPAATNEVVSEAPVADENLGDAPAEETHADYNGTEPPEPETLEGEPAEQVYTWDGHVYQIFSDNAFPPFHMLNLDTGEFYGFDVDLIEAIAADQGFQIERHHVGFSAAMGHLEAGTADGMIAGMSITEERRERFDFSDGYFVAGQILVVPAGSPIQGFADLTGETVAVKIGTVGAIYGETMAEEHGFDLIFFEDSPMMYSAIIMGSVAAAIEDRPVIEFAIYQGNLALETRGDTLNPRYYGFAVRRGEFPELIGMFNQGLANLRASGYYYEILARYGLGN
ncbi:MAG: transporter substrate-binding domain-containing protein [Defluviitaleaceae bacterium]|nr:transporter substrate-binding domain-containing protein [Defluviitaleaceae bacterium]MCL2263181.1 transporter substrate-binding domain-containing protein [Defluviitaleaceae bacterium]